VPALETEPQRVGVPALEVLMAEREALTRAKDGWAAGFGDWLDCARS
jgi:hypothetical protein